MNIIAFSGKKQSGKTSAAKYIKNRNINVSYINFADYLKAIVLNCFGEPDEKRGNLYSDCIYSDLDSDKEKLMPCGDTGRQLLQWLGTDIMRAKDTDCWVKAYKAEVLKSFRSDWPPELVLTADVRFPNEVKCIQEMGGHVIRLTRNIYSDTHSSEMALDNMEDMFDVVVDNGDMTLEEKNETVWKIIKEKGWL